MKNIGKFIGTYFQLIDEFKRKMISNGHDLPFQSLFPFFFCCGIIGGLMGFFIGLNENDYGVLLSSLLIAIISVVGPFLLNRRTKLKK